MSIGEMLMQMLEDLQRCMNYDEEPELPMIVTAEAASIVREERRLEREAAAADGIPRAEIVVSLPGYMGTLRFHGDSGHLHGMLWAEKEPGRWAAYPFAGQLQQSDPHRLVARLRELGTPYDNPQGGGIPQFPRAGGDAGADDDDGSAG